MTKDNSRLNCMLTIKQKESLKELASEFNKSTVTSLIRAISDRKLALIDKNSLNNLKTILGINNKNVSKK